MILHQNCEPELAKDKNLPRDSYIVSYMNDNLLCYDIVRSGNQVEVFDHYHDNSYVVKSIQWTEGLINPKSFGYVPKDNSKKRRK
jgi:hypothetical protein